MITNRLTAGTLNPPTATVSFPLRRVSCQLLPMTWSTPTPVPNVMVEVRPPSTKVELLDGSNFFWFAHGGLQAVPIMRSQFDISRAIMIRITWEFQGRASCVKYDTEGLWRCPNYWYVRIVYKRRKKIYVPVIFPNHLMVTRQYGSC